MILNKEVEIGIKRIDAMYKVLGIIKSLKLNWDRYPLILPQWRHGV
ncbi:MAG: hypothetical protein N2053_09315 [Chitinispirillaceae bacterium]|nr:hypothetical protein [Chitinispirillaceae bacterium]